MSNKSKTEYRVGIGASSILMVLVILALTAVSLLSFRSAKNTEALTKRNLQMTVAYYEASANAQKKLAAIDELLVESQMAANIVLGEALQTELFSTLGMAELLIWQDGEDIRFSFVEDAQYERQIEVEGIFTLSSDTQRYHINKYRLISQPTEDDSAGFQLMGW